MRPPAGMDRAVWRILWRVLSVPIFAKTLGIGALVALVFGSVILIETRRGLSHNLYEILADRVVAEARALAVSLERPLTTGDRVTIVERIHKTKALLPDLRYVIVRDADARIVAHSFESFVPAGLVSPPPAAGDGQRRILENAGDGLIFEAVAPILKGRAGLVQAGISDDLVTRELAALTTSIVWGLGVSVAIGIGLAITLAYILTKPVLDLKQTAGRIKVGDFNARAEVYSGDEIGDLAVAFNEMAESLQRYRRQVEEKEKVRLALIDRIVRSQEEERKLISRELHDEFGQSLLAILMKIQSSQRYASLAGPVRRELEGEVSDAIDELRRIIKGMRPTILDDYGLDSALSSYVQEVSGHTGLEIAYTYNSAGGAARLPAPLEVTLYRVAQEAITNIIRHANASHVSVVVLQSAREVRLLVEDDGCGFDRSTVSNERSLGLLGMGERVALLGGSLDVESIPEEGTTIRARVPLRWSAS